MSRGIGGGAICRSRPRRKAVRLDLCRSWLRTSVALAIRALRPTNAVKPIACNASKRLAIELARSAAQVRIGSAMPLRFLAPRSSKSKRSPSSFRVLSAMTTVFGSAIPCRRAARFGVSPTTVYSAVEPTGSENITVTWRRSAVSCGARRCPAALGGVLRRGGRCCRNSRLRSVFLAAGEFGYRSK